MYKKALVGLVFLVVMVILTTRQSFAASLTNLSDTVSTSRPSAGGSLDGTQYTGGATANDQPALAPYAAIYDDNGVYLASDSATVYADPVAGGETTDVGILVASMSAAGVPSASHRTIYFSGSITHAHHKGDAIVVPITAVHTISFKPNTSIPIGGKIILTFPKMASVDSNPASPSASGFNLGAFQNATNVTNDIKVNVSGGATCSFAVTNTGASGTPTVTCTTATAAITAGTTVTILVGCTSGAAATCAASNQAPVVINPMRVQPPGANAGQGASTTQADNWKVGVTTQDNNSVTLDTGTAVVGTIESVQVQASIDPTLTFQLIGVASGTTINNSFVSGCPNTTSDVSSGIATLATNINFGTVGTGITIEAQKAVVSTNGVGGYVLTATSSGSLTDPAQGYSVASSTTPAALVAGTENFGIHPCGSDVTNATTTWNSGGNSSQTSLTSGTGFIGWPTATTALQLANHTGTANNATTAIEYAITASATTPAGFYTAIITYVATPTFN